jgi:hypothetical protein
MGTLNIPASSLVYVDTSPVIYSVEKFPEYVPLLAPLWLKLQAGEIQIVSSELILMETLVGSIPLFCLSLRAERSGAWQSHQLVNIEDCGIASSFLLAMTILFFLLGMVRYTTLTHPTNKK